LSSLRWPSAKNKKRGGVGEEEGSIPPTPYEIFGQRERSEYSKRRFCALVKLYHPDRHCQHGGDAELAQLSRAMKLERYRLVVAANALLSDPMKKAAYDQYGIGWASSSRGSSSSSSSSSSSRHPVGREGEIFRYGFYHYRHHFHHYHNQHHRHGFYGEHSSARGQWSSRASSGDDYSAYMNATWEDWEKWYRHRHRHQHQHQHRQQRGAQHEQQPLFAENGSFAAVVVALALLGGVVETMRAHSFAAALSQQRELVHSAVARERELRNAAGVVGAKNDRIQAFLRAREPPVGGGGGGGGAGAAAADSSLAEERDWKKPPSPSPSLSPPSS
jgi:hypothetical protein